MKKVTAIVWHSTAVRLKKAASLIKDEVDAKVYSCRLLDDCWMRKRKVLRGFLPI